MPNKLISKKKNWIAAFLGYGIIIYYYLRARKPVIKAFRPEHFTVLVKNIDRKLVDSSILKKRFLDIYPNEILEASLVLDYRKKKQSAAETNQSSLSFTKEEPIRSTGMGFVSFSSTDIVRDCLMRRSRIAFGDRIWIVEPAPPPEDLIWSQMHISPKVRGFRIISLFLLLLFLSVFVLSVLPTTAMAMWRLLLTPPNVNKLEKNSPSRYIGFGWEIVTSWLPPLLLYLANSLLLPLLVRWQSQLSGFWRRSSIAVSIMRGNVLFLLIHTILIPLTNDTLLTLADVWVAAESNIDVTFWVRQTGEYLLTNSASFALRYILDCTCISSVSQLLQLPRLLHCKVCQPQTYEFDFGYWYAFGLSMFTLVLVLSIVSPLVLPFGVIFFSIKYFVDKYNFTHKIWNVEEHFSWATHAAETPWMLFAVVLMQFAMAGFFFMIGQLWGGFALFIGCFVGFAVAIRLHQPVYIAPVAGISLTEEADIAVLKAAYNQPRQKNITTIDEKKL